MPDGVIGIKMGSTYSCVAKLDENQMPVTKVIKSCVSIVKDSITDEVIGEVIGVDNGNSIFPLDKGLIENDNNIATTIKIIKKLDAPTQNKVVAAIPALELKDGRNRLKNCLLSALEPDKMILYPEVYCGAVHVLGYEMIGDVRRLKAPFIDFLAVNLGSTTTEILVSMHGRSIYLSTSTDVSGNQVDHKISTALETSLGKVLIDIQHIRQIKENFNMDQPSNAPFRIMNGSSEIQEISAPHVVERVLEEYAAGVAKLIRTVLSKHLDRDAITKVIENPIIATGGMGNIPGIISRIQKNLRESFHYDNITVLSQPDGQIAPCLGALKLACEIPWNKVPS